MTIATKPIRPFKANTPEPTPPPEPVKKNKAPLTFVILAFVLIPFMLLSLTENFIQFSAFTIGLCKGLFGVLMFWVIDKFALSEIDTIKELKRGNIAYAIFLLALAIILGVAMLGS